MRRLTALLGNSQKLDGGAMFGHVPKSIWNQWISADEKNRITLSCRALLIQEENRNILLETGIGAFFEPALRDRYGVVETNHVLLESLQQIGLTHQDIDVVILSHLHFDHAGGLLSSWETDKANTLLFPKAHYLVSKAGWERATHPHMRDRASFIPGLTDKLKDSNRLMIVDKERCDLMGTDYHFMFTHGHTPGLMHTIVTMPESPLVFASDLIPGSLWVHLPVGMGYDRSAELVSDEKQLMLDFVIKHKARIFYTHDPVLAVSKVQQESSGKYVAIKADL